MQMKLMFVSFENLTGSFAVVMLIFVLIINISKIL
jgi:hypothetical protein